MAPLLIPKPFSDIIMEKVTEQYLLEYRFKNTQQNTSKPNKMLHIRIY